MSIAVKELKNEEKLKFQVRGSDSKGVRIKSVVQVYRSAGRWFSRVVSISLTGFGYDIG